MYVMSFDESRLPEPDWSEKPIVVLVGTAPDSPKYRALHDYLREQLLMGAIEVVHLKEDDVKPTDLVLDETFDPARIKTGEAQLFVPQLDFSFQDLENPGIDRIKNDPELKKLRSTTRLHNPPTIVIGLQKDEEPEFADYCLVPEIKAGPDGLDNTIVVARVRKSRRSSDGLVIGSNDSRLLDTFSYFASPEVFLSYPAQRRFEDDRVVFSYLLEAGSIEISIEPETRSNRTRTGIKVEGALKDLAHKAAKGKLSESETNLLKTLITEKIIEDGYFRFRSSSFGRAYRPDDPPRFPSEFSESESLLNYLDTYLANVRERKLKEARGVDPSLLPQALQDEIAQLEAEHRLLGERLTGIRREIADGNSELAGIETAIASERSGLEAEIAALREGQRALEEERSRFGELVQVRQIKTTESVSEIAHALHDFQFSPKKRLQALRRAFGGDTPIDTISFAINRHERETIERVAFQIRSSPEQPINLYDATLFFLAQSAIDVTRLQVQPHLVTDHIATARMLKLSYDHASETERTWFRNLDQLLPDDTAQEILSYLAQAAISERMTDHRVTMSGIAEILEGTYASEDRVELPESRHEAIAGNVPVKGLGTGLPTPAIDTEVAVTEPPTR